MPSASLTATQTPSILAKQAMGATALGSWFNTGATALDSVSNALAGGYQARVAFNNAALAKQDASAAEAAGEFAAGRENIRTAQTIGAQKAGYAGANIDVGSGTPSRVAASTQQLGDLDAAVIRYNAQRDAYNSKLQASNYRAGGTLAALGTGFGVARDVGRTYSSFVAGSNALRNQRLTFGQTGVNPNG